MQGRIFLLATKQQTHFFSPFVLSLLFCSSLWIPFRNHFCNQTSKSKIQWAKEKLSKKEEKEEKAFENRTVEAENSWDKLKKEMFNRN